MVVSDLLKSKYHGKPLSDFDFEMFVRSDMFGPGEFWIPIDVRLIKDLRKIEFYVEVGLLRVKEKETLLECFERGFHENAQKELEDGNTAGSVKLGPGIFPVEGGLVVGVAVMDPEKKLNPST